MTEEEALGFAMFALERVASGGEIGEPNDVAELEANAAEALAVMQRRSS